MGADLYIRSITNAAAKKYKPAFEDACRERDSAHQRGDEAGEKAAQARVMEAYDAMYPEDGYFRDSYNATSLLGQIGLSWWQDVIPMLSKGGYLRGENLRKLIAEIEARPVPSVDALDLHGAQVDAEGENSREGWHAYFVAKRERLLRFLRSADNGNKTIKRAGIYCSL